jgi:hypothetical protein
MSKKNYSIHWENDEAVSFEVNGTVYKSLDQIPEGKNKRKIIAMMAVSSEPDFDGKETTAPQKEDTRVETIILLAFSGIAILMLLIAGISSANAIMQISHEKSTPGQVTNVVMRREYVNERDRIVQEYYYPVVQFIAQDGRSRIVQMSAGSDSPDYEKGDEVTIRYNPDHPLEARIDSFWSSATLWILPVITGILGLGFLAAVLAVRWVMK